MSIPADKKELKDAILKNYSQLRLELHGIPLSLTKARELPGHSKNSSMSVCNQLAYLVGWGELVLKWNREKEKKKQPDFPDTGYKWKELGKLAEKFYEDYEGESYNSLLAKLDETVNHILELVDKKSNRQLYGEEWYEKYTLGRMIQLNTSSPFMNAKARIRKWKKEKGLI